MERGLFGTNSGQCKLLSKPTFAAGQEFQAGIDVVAGRGEVFQTVGRIIHRKRRVFGTGLRRVQSGEYRVAFQRKRRFCAGFGRFQFVGVQSWLTTWHNEGFAT